MQRSGRCGAAVASWRLRGRDDGGLWGPGPGGRERRAAVRAAGPGAGSGKPGPEVGGKRAGLAVHPTEPASAGWELGGGVGSPLLPFLPHFCHGLELLRCGASVMGATGRKTANHLKISSRRKAWLLPSAACDTTLILALELQRRKSQFCQGQNC